MVLKIKMDYNDHWHRQSLNRVILPAQKLPITAAHEFLRGLVQRWFSSRSAAAAKLDSSTTDAVKAHVAHWEEQIVKCNVYPIQDSVRYQVTNEELGDGIINVEEKSCTCLRWDLDGVPCVHAMAYAMYSSVSISHLCHPYYSKEFLLGAYSRPIIPLPDKGAWLEADAAARIEVLPMAMEKQAGRPKEKRIPSAGEFHRGKKCGNCGTLGNSQITCRNPPLICGNCGATGHRIEDCQGPTMSCGKCGTEGHTGETCQNMTIRSSIGSTSAQGSDVAVSSKRRRVMHCRHCGGAGHTVRTCSEVCNSVPNAELVGEDCEGSELNLERSSHIDGEQHENIPDV